MKGMSEREYAAHSGLSRGGVQKARKNGRLVVHDDGSINAAASDVRRADMTDPDQQRRSLGGDGLASGPGDTTSYIKARTALTVYAAQERQLAVQKKKGTLVDRARAETLVFRLARQERDVWVTWPGRVAALMAAQIMAEVERQGDELGRRLEARCDPRLACCFQGVSVAEAHKDAVQALCFPGGHDGSEAMPRVRICVLKDRDYVSRLRP